MLGGCTDLGFTAKVTNREPFMPLPAYEAWWSANELCSSRTGDLTRVQWFLATSIVSNGALAFGAWTAPHQIVLVRGFEEDEVVVRHEMLHDLLDGDPDHRSPLWATCDLIPR